jgi:putative peptidoglycan lipid II flippase
MNRVARNSALVTALNGAGFAIGLALYTVIAAVFGVNVNTDAFFLALTVPWLFIGPAVAATSTALVPALADCRVHRPDRLPELVGSALVVGSVAAVIASLIIGATTPIVLAATGRGASSEWRTLVLSNVVLLLPMVFAQTAAAVLGAASNAAGCFWLPATASIARVGSTLFLVWVLRSSLGHSGLPVAFSLGSLGQLVVLWVFWGHARTRVVPRWRVDDELRAAIRMAVPLLIGTAAIQVSILGSRIIAGMIGPGSITALDYASRAIAAITEIASTGVVAVALSDWSNRLARGDHKSLPENVQATAGFLIFALIPIVVTMVGLRLQIVQVWLAAASLENTFSEATATVFGWLAVAMALDIVGRVFVQLLIVRRLGWPLAVFAVIRLATTILIARGLVGILGIAALGIAEVAGLVGSVVLLIVWAQRRAAYNVSTLAFTSLGRLALASAVAVSVLAVLSRYSGNQPGVVVLVAAFLVVPISYFTVAWALGVPQARTLAALLIARVSA